VSRRMPHPPRAFVWLALCGALSFPAAASASQLYVSDHSSNSVSAFTIGTEGLPSPIGCSGESCEAETEPEPAGLAISPNGQFLYVADADKGGKGTVSAFHVEAGGALSADACEKSKDCRTDVDPAGVATSPNGQFLYIANEGSNKVSAYSIGAQGKLSKIACEEACATGNKPFGVAVATNSQFLYTTNLESNTVSAFRIGEHGGLAPIECSGCATGSVPTGIGVSPNGQFLFVADRSSNTVSPYRIEASGTLSPIECAEEQCNAESEPTGIAVSPDGEYLYSTDAGSNTVSIFQIGADGQLKRVFCAIGICAAGGSDPVGVSVSPDGQFLFTANAGSSTLSPFSIGLGGMLSSLTCAGASCSTGSGRSFESLAISPDPGPTAAFSDTPEPAGSASAFDGEASTAPPEESVARYDWSFGDGSEAQNAGPTPSHVYSAPGTYTVTLTVTDNLGCSDVPISTGQTASCGGLSAAQSTAQIVVPAPSPSSSTFKFNLGKLKPFVISGKAPQSEPAPSLTFSDLSESAKSWREGGALARISAASKRAPLGTTFSFYIGETGGLSEHALVTFVFTRPASGRRVGKKCEAPSKSNQGKRHCTRTLTAGTLKLSAGTGRSKVRFEGAISKHKRLTPASYTLLASVTVLGKRSSTRTLRFTIVKGS
jgi:DNA-binding beta-propeller fold protein YncE